MNKVLQTSIAMTLTGVYTDGLLNKEISLDEFMAAAAKIIDMVENSKEAKS